MFSLKQLQEIADARIEALVEGGTLDNAKPIYCHPITIQSTGESLIFRITMLIFNNDSTPFTRTSFKTWLDNLLTELGTTVRVMISGAYNTGEKIIIASHLSHESVGYFVNGINVSDGSQDFVGGEYSTLFPSSVGFVDAVNKIN